MAITVPKAKVATIVKALNDTIHRVFGAAEIPSSLLEPSGISGSDGKRLDWRYFGTMEMWQTAYMGYFLCGQTPISLFIPQSGFLPSE